MLEVGKKYKDENKWDVNIVGEFNDKFIGLVPSCNHHRFYNADGTPENPSYVSLVVNELDINKLDIIDLNKRYQTISGYAVKLFDIIDNTLFGAVHVNNEKWKSFEWNSNGTSKNFTKSPYDLVLAQDTNYSDFKINDRVIVWQNANGIKHFRHFAGVNKKGRAKVFSDGQTSFSSNGSTQVWDNCILASDLS